MGQIFHATVYNTETRKCISIDADKFHANCYSYCGIVCIVHYLLRNGPYNVMWCGGYVGIYDNIRYFLSEEKLLGISVSKDIKYFERHYDEDISKSFYYDKLKFIDENHNTWEKMDVWDEALNYFDYKNTKSVKYDGYLINHTKKQVIDLKDYYHKSLLINRHSEEYLIDLIPCLTESGSGSVMALFDGASEEVTEELIGKWCGDLLEIVDQYPEDYVKVNCCFASLPERLFYCIKCFGIDEEGYVLKNKEGEKFKGVKLLLFSFDLGEAIEVSKPSFFKRVKVNDEFVYKPFPINDKRTREEKEEKEEIEKKSKKDK